MGKMILRCSEKMTNEVVLGELGWWEMKGRRDMLRLRFWGKIERMQNSRLVKVVYEESRRRDEQGENTWSHIHDNSWTRLGWEGCG